MNEYDREVYEATKDKSQYKAIRIFGIVMVVIALFFGFRLIKGATMVLEEKHRLNNEIEQFKTLAYSTTGEITNVRIEEHESLSHSATTQSYESVTAQSFYCTVDFEDSKGNKQSEEVRVNSSKYKQGDTVEIFYKPDDPHDCMVNEPVPIIFNLVAGGFFASGGFFAIILLVGIKLVFKR